MKILVFIEHDIIIRHFVFSGALSELIRRHEVVFVFPEAGHRRVQLDPGMLDLRARYERLAIPSPRLRLWQHLFLTDILRWRPGQHHRALRRVNRFTVGFKGSLMLGAYGLPGIYPIFRRRALARLAQEAFVDLERLLDREEPDLLLHPSVLSGLYINDVVSAGARRAIPTIIVMNSWDNPSSKRGVVGWPDWLLVWGEQTRQHAVEFVDMPPERVVVFGAAQFEVFRQPPRIDRGEFCRRHDIDPRDRILLYAGSSKGTDEFAHLRLLEDAIERGVLERTVVVYRPHPWGNGGKGGERIIDHAWRHVRLESTMRGYLEGVKAGQRGITTPDYRDTHDVLSAIDALVSPLSTILLESALHGKPSLCFLPEDHAPHHQLSVPLRHFEEFFAVPDFKTARGTAALIDSVAALMAEVDDPTASRRYRAAAEPFVATFDRPYAQRLAEFVEAHAAVAPGKAA